MKRLLFTLIVVGALGYLGWIYYRDHQEELPKFSIGTPPERTEPQTLPETAGDRTAGFRSKIPIPEGPADQKHLAPPGVYYMTERAVITTDTGVKAVNPGEQVRLVARRPGFVKVTIGGVDFEVKESQVTNDLDVAREAEKKAFLNRGGRS